MRAGLAFVATVIGGGLLLRGIVAPALDFFVAAAALIAWRIAASPLRKIEVALAAALTSAAAAQGHVFEGAWAAAIVVSALELMRIFR
jgi:hypothetical protein